MRSTITNARHIFLLLSLCLCAAVFVVGTGCDNSKDKRKDAPEVGAQLESVRVYIELGQYDKALAALNRLEGQSPNDREIAKLKEVVLTKLGEQPVVSTGDLQAAADALLSDPNDQAAAETLAKGKDESVPYLLKLLQSDNSLVKLIVIRLLAQNPTNEAIPALLDGLNSSSPDTAYYSHMGLCKLTNETIDILLRDDGTPDGAKLTEVWNKKLSSSRLVARGKPTPLRLSPAYSPASATNPIRQSSAAPAQTTGQSRPTVSTEPARPQPSVRPTSPPPPSPKLPSTLSPSPKPTIEPTAKPTKTPSAPLLSGPKMSGKTRPGIGGPQGN